MNEKEIIENMSKEILRLQKELRQYKWTKDQPLSKAMRRIKMHFYWDEGNEYLPPQPRVFYDPIDGVGTDIPVFKLIEYFHAQGRELNG